MKSIKSFFALSAILCVSMLYAVDNNTYIKQQEQMAELFQRDKSTISRHIKNILECGELSADSVGYRVNSLRGVQFRMWATSVLREYLIKGFAMNDSLLKNAGGGKNFV